MSREALAHVLVSSLTDCLAVLVALLISSGLAFQIALDYLHKHGLSTF